VVALATFQERIAVPLSVIFVGLTENWITGKLAAVDGVVLVAGVEIVDGAVKVIHPPNRRGMASVSSVNLIVLFLHIAVKILLHLKALLTFWNRKQLTGKLIDF
jgi:hypothetical protein